MTEEVKTPQTRFENEIKPRIELAALWQLKLIACKKASQDISNIPAIIGSGDNKVTVTITTTISAEEVFEFLKSFNN